MIRPYTTIDLWDDIGCPGIRLRYTHPNGYPPEVSISVLTETPIDGRIDYTETDHTDPDAEPLHEVSQVEFNANDPDEMRKMLGWFTEGARLVADLLAEAEKAAEVEP